MPGLGIPVPNPIDLFGGGLLSGGADAIFGAFGKWIYDAFVSGASTAFDAAVKGINNQGAISFAPSSWWGTKVGLANTGTSLWATVVGLSLAVMVLCLIFSAIQGALVGDAMVPVKAMAVTVPTSMLGIVAVVAITATLVGAVDRASTAVLAGLDGNFKTWIGNPGPAGLMPGFLMFITMLGGLLVWLELILRAGFVFLFVVLSPMALAVRVWPAMGGFFRRFAEIGVALILSKFVIAVALALGSAAMAGGAKDNSAGPALAAMAVGAGLMLVSAFAPFVILRMVHGVEGALAHQGMSHAPGRAAMTAVQLATSALLISRLAGGSGGGGGGGGITPPPTPPERVEPPPPRPQLGAGSPVIEAKSRPVDGPGATGAGKAA